MQIEKAIVLVRRRLYYEARYKQKREFAMSLWHKVYDDQSAQGVQWLIDPTKCLLMML